WILDNVTPLRQLDANATAAAAFLFHPARVCRVRPAGFTGTPSPKDEPIAPNPPFGAAIDYVLAKPAAQPVTLEIHDAQGAVVQHWSSADTVVKPDPARLRTAPQWFTPAPHLEASAGMHRFVWTLQYAPPPGPPGEGRGGGGGVWAPPGDYDVKLTVDGKELARTLSLAPDPRVKLDDAAYREQFVLARSIEATSARLSTATAAAGTLRKAVVQARGDAKGALADTLDRF